MSETPSSRVGRDVGNLFVVVLVERNPAKVIPTTFPSPEQLQPLLEKVESHPGSIVLLAIEQPEVCNFCRVTVAWLSADERKALRRALEVCRRRRQEKTAAENGL